MAQITLVANKHYHNVLIGVISQLLEPSFHVFIGQMFCNIVDEQGSHRATVVGAGDRTVPLLAGGVPDLSFDRFVVHLDATSGKLDPDGGLAFQIELIAGEAGQEVALADAGISNEDNCRPRGGLGVSGHVGRSMPKADKPLNK